MKVLKYRLHKQFKSKYKRIALLIVLAILITLQVSTFLYTSNQQTHAEPIPQLGKIGLDLAVDHSQLVFEPNSEAITEAMLLKPQLEEQERKEEIRAKQIASLVVYLKKQKSPVATEGYAAQIIDLSQANGADYRVIVAIMGAESGFCKAPYKISGANSHNCFGYLNGVTYGSFTEAFNALIPKISKQYAVRYGWDFEALAKAYGQHGWEKTSAFMYRIASSL